jgi:hypothetical protein
MTHPPPEVQHESHWMPPAHAPAPPTLSLRQLIFDPGQFVALPAVCVAGDIVVLDQQPAEGHFRMDISADGAKLICNLEYLDKASFERLLTPGFGVGSRVVVVGKVRKQQRRTFVEAHTLLLA